MADKNKPIIKTVKFNSNDPIDQDLIRRIEQSGMKFNKLVKFLLFAFFHHGQAGYIAPVNIPMDQIMGDDKEETETDELQDLGIDLEKAKNIVIEADDDDW